MIVPYLARLACLCLASFFLTHAAVAAVVSLGARRAVARAARMRARTGARWLLALRLLPATAATLAVAGLCAPSYLRLEPDAGAERIGPVCLAAAIFGAAICALGLARAAAAGIRSARVLRACRRAAEGDAPVLLLAGILRPKLIVSRGVRAALTAEQLAAAVRHEEAHARSHDNLKRLLIALTPEAFPSTRGVGALEAGWRRLTEWAADDSAAESAEGALALASALVRVGRMGGAVAAPPLATSLLADAGDLEARVERLIEPRPCEAGPRLLGPGIGLAAVVGALVLHPGTLRAVHGALEALAH